MQEGNIQCKTLLKPSDASLHFHVPVSTIYVWYAQGKIDGIKVNGKCLRIYTKSLLALLDSRSGTKEREKRHGLPEGAPGQKEARA